MLRFIVRRIFFIILVWVFIVFFSNLGMRMARNSEISTPDYNLVQHSKRAWQDTRTFLSGVLRGDLGTTRIPSGLVPIKDILGESYVNSMGLLLVALVIAAILGLGIGSMAALTKRRMLVLPLLTLTILGISTPSFFAGLLLQVGELRYLAITGRRLVSMAGFGWDLEHMLMPVLVLAARPLAYLTRAAFLSLNRVMEEDFIRTAFSKGLSLRRIVNVHALRNIAIPLLTAVGVSVRFSLSTLPVVEFFFNWPGMGRRLLEAINTRQTPVVVALASALGLTFLLINLLLDVAYRIIDPRVREP
jgi:peptide/nickel transport system permease protein